MKTIIYKKDSKGFMRFLEISTDGVALNQKSGKVGTPNPITHSRDCKAKNIGKANETTPEEQAIVEANNMVKKRLREEYHETQEEAQKCERLFPMLASVYGDHKDKINYSGNVFMQPKLDGMRCLAQVKGGVASLISREGKDITTMPHIVAAIEKMAGGRNMILDGELYQHGLSFQNIMSLIKKNRPKSSDVGFHIYDIVEDIDFENRSTKVRLLNLKSPLETVPTIRIRSEEEVRVIHDKYIDEGYEGTMVRHGDTPYKQNARSTSLLKNKDFDDVVLKLVDVIPTDSRPTHGTPVFEYNGQVNEAGVKMSHEEREDLLKNKSRYIGKSCEVRYFGETDGGKMRMPVMVGFRLDK